MSIRYRLKRSSGPVHEPIPAHPDAIYRPQNRPTPAKISPATSDAIAPRAMAEDAVVAAPLAVGGSGFSPWWIIGPLLALLAAMVVGALAYAMKKKHDSKKQAEEENDSEKREIDNKKTNKKKEENSDDDDSARKLPVENVPLRSMKPDIILEGQTRTASMSSTAKGNSTSSAGSISSKNINKEASGRSALMAHGLSLMNDTSALSSIHLNSASSPSYHPPSNMTSMAKPNSDVSNKSDEKNTSKTIHNTFTDPLLVSPPKNIRSVSTHKTEPNYSGSLPPTSNVSPTSSTASITQKLGHPNGRSDLNVSKPKSNANLHKKENQLNNKSQPNDFNKTHDEKSPFHQDLTNVDRVDHTRSLKAGQDNKKFTLPSSRSGMNDLNSANISNDGHINQPNSPEQHGIVQSPLITSIPTGSKRSEKEKPQNRTDQSEERKSSNPDLQRQHSSKENIHSNKSKNPYSSSDINKEKQPSTLTIHSKPDPLSELSETTSSSSVASTEPTKEKNSRFSNPNDESSKNIVQPSDQYSMLNKNDLNKFSSHHIQNLTKEYDSIDPSENRLQTHIDPYPNNNISNELTTSLTQPGFTNHGKTISLMPNVPQCKTNTSSDDDDYDEFYLIPTNDSTIQQTTSKHKKTHQLNSNSNINASTYRKKRTSCMHKPLTKRFHFKDKI